MKNTAAQLSAFIKNAYLGKNWVEVDFKNVLEDITLEEANTRFVPLNSIAGIVYHLDYYVSIVLGRLKGELLPSNANNGFDIQHAGSPEDWEELLIRFYRNVELFAAYVKDFDDQRLQEDFLDNKYGNNIYNIQGIVEHAYYHLGQIVLLKKMIRSKNFTK